MLAFRRVDFNLPPAERCFKAVKMVLKERRCLVGIFMRSKDTGFIGKGMDCSERVVRVVSCVH